VLLARAGDINAADDELVERFTPDVIASVVDAVPDSLLNDKTIAADFPNAQTARQRYVDYLVTRLNAPRDFVAEATDARARAERMPPRRLAARR